MFNESDLTQNQVWIHNVRQLKAVIVCISTCQTNSDPGCGTQRCVVYMELDSREFHHREVSEFLDGRFSPTLYMKGD